MKTINELNQLIATELAALELRNADLQKCKDAKEYKKVKNSIVRIGNKLDELNHYKRYLESQPTEDFLKEELSKINNKIELLNEKYSTWEAWSAPKDKDPKEYRSIFNRETGISKMAKQVKTIKFLLG